MLANPATELFFGGIRKTLFDLDCLLTKHPLFRVDGNLELFTHPHFSDHGRVADVSCVLRHYKLVSNCFETSAMNRDAFPATRRGYEDLLELIEKASDFNIKNDSAIRYEGTDELLAAKFLFASPDYVGWTGADRDD